MAVGVLRRGQTGRGVERGHGGAHRLTVPVAVTVAEAETVAVVVDVAVAVAEMVAVAVAEMVVVAVATVVPEGEAVADAVTEPSGGRGLAASRAANAVDGCACATGASVSSAISPHSITTLTTSLARTRTRIALPSPAFASPPSGDDAMPSRRRGSPRWEPPAGRTATVSVRVRHYKCKSSHVAHLHGTGRRRGWARAIAMRLWLERTAMARRQEG